jgi:hypothetical protein
MVDFQLDAQNSYSFTYNTFIKILYMFAFVEFVLLHSMWPHAYVICACLVFLSVGDLLAN